MASLQILQGTFHLSDTRTLNLDQLDLSAAKAGLLLAPTAAVNPRWRARCPVNCTAEGRVKSDFGRPVRLSLEQLQKLVAEEWQRNNTDLLSEGEDDTGRTAAESFRRRFSRPTLPAACRSSSASQPAVTPL